MKYILPVIVILLAASVLAQEIDVTCYDNCYEDCFLKADKITCDTLCRERCMTVARVTGPPPETAPGTCEDACRERISNNNPRELEQCILDCQAKPDTCEELCDYQFRGNKPKIQECYIRECGHPRPPVLSCEDVCRRDYGKDERQFQACMEKRCLVTAVMPRSEVIQTQPETRAIMPKEEILPPTPPGCREECQRSFERCTSGCGRPECPRQQEPEPQCETRCIQGFRQCVSEISPQDDAIEASRQCKQNALECFANCLPHAPRGEIALPRQPTPEPQPEPSEGLLARLWHSFGGT